MLSLFLALAGSTAPPWSCTPGQECQETETWSQQEQQEIEWFDGTWEELILAANDSQQLIFIELWSKYCPYCKKLGETTLRDETVIAELQDLLCFGADMQARANLNLVRRFRPQPPTLIFLEPDGELREMFRGKYLSPEEFVSEVRRIKRNEGTLTELRARIRKDPEDFQARYDLAFKLQGIGDLRGFQAQIDAIRELDPEARSRPARCLRFYELRKQAQSTLDLEGLYGFLATESDEQLLFLGWLTAWELEQYLAKVSDKEPDREGHRRRGFAAARSLWPHVPEDRWLSEGNNIAWFFYQNREHLTAADMEWALAVSRKVVGSAPRQAYVIDTLACCLFAVGRKEEAVDKVKRCIELDPFNPKWKERLVEFLR